MEQETYFVDFENFTKLVGFGPAEGNNCTPPLFAILDDWVFTCEYYTGDWVGERADIYFPKRNYILVDEFNSVNLVQHVENLVNEGKELIMDLGEGRGDERSFIWKRKSAKFSKNFRVNKAIRIRSASQIARAVQANKELLSILGVHSSAKFHQEKQRETNVSEAIVELFQECQRVEAYPYNRKNLDQTDGTYIG